MMHEESSQAFHDVLDVFDLAWQGGSPPRIEDFLPPPGDPSRLALLVGLVRIDLERRINVGEAVRIEHAYFTRFPELGTDAEVAVPLVLHEYQLRARSDPSLSLREYVQRFPNLAGIAPLLNRSAES